MIIHTRLLFFASAITINQNLILIHPDNDTIALREHEYTHQRQMKRIGTIYFWWKYVTSKEFRKTVEVEAYKVSVANGDDLYSCSRWLATKYGLGLTFEQAKFLIVT